MIIYFNPDCSKCKEVLGILDNNACSVEIRNYLQVPPSVEELKVLVQILGCKAMDIVRVKETLFQEQFAHLLMDEDACLLMLSQHPILIERPILIDGQRALLGRPVEKVFDFIRMV